MRIGAFGGGFVPVRNRHLGVARAVADALGLDEVWLVPAAQAPLKNAGVQAGGASRLAMVRLARNELAEREGERRLRVSDSELRRGGVSQTAETLRVERPADAFTWIVGADQLARLGGWREPQVLAEPAEWAAYARPGHA